MNDTIETAPISGVLNIRGGEYEFVVLPVEPGGGAKAIVRMTSPKGDVYDIAELEDGRCTCECWNWIKVREQIGEDCKHIEACRRAGLVCRTAPKAKGQRR